MPMPKRKPNYNPTSTITDVNYIRPLFGYLICGSIFFTCIKLPYEQMVYAAGTFKETRNGAFVEAAQA